MSKVIETKQDAEEFLTYIGFLQAGAFEQGSNSLQYALNPKTGKIETWCYCVLGVGAELFIPDKKKSLAKDKYGNEYMMNILVPQDENVPLWLRKLNRERILDEKGRLRFISGLNDAGKSFEYIADLLLKHYSNELEEALTK